jgi:hypothetical protein
MSRFTPYVGKLPLVPTQEERGEKRVRKSLRRIRGDADLVAFIKGTYGWELIPGNIRDEGDQEWVVPVDDYEAPFPADGIPDTPPTLFGCPIAIGYKHWGCLNEVPNVILDVGIDADTGVDLDGDPEELATKLKTVVETHADMPTDDPEVLIERASEVLDGEDSEALTDGGEDIGDGEIDCVASDDNQDSETSDAATDTVLGFDFSDSDADEDGDDDPVGNEVSDADDDDPLEAAEELDNVEDGPTLRERLPSPIVWTRAWLGRRRDEWRRYQARKGWRWLTGNADTLILQQDGDAEIYTDRADYSQPSDDEAKWSGYITRSNEDRYDGRGAGGSPERIRGLGVNLGLAYAPVAKLISPVSCRLGRNTHALRLADGTGVGRRNDVQIEERACVWPADILLNGGEHVTQEGIERAIEQTRAKANPPGSELVDTAMKLGALILALILGATIGDPSLLFESVQRMLWLGVGYGV